VLVASPVSVVATSGPHAVPSRPAATINK
jgi:hypothetical protein